MGADRSDISGEYFYRLIVILNPFSTVAWLMRLVGIGFLFSGVTDLITTIYVSKRHLNIMWMVKLKRRMRK